MVFIKTKIALSKILNYEKRFGRNHYNVTWEAESDNAKISYDFYSYNKKEIKKIEIPSCGQVAEACLSFDEIKGYKPLTISETELNGDNFELLAEVAKNEFYRFNVPISFVKSDIKKFIPGNVIYLSTLIY